jgi:hypothetical protein
VRPVTSATNFATPFTPHMSGNQDSAKANEELARIASLSITSFRKAIDRLDPDYLSTPETPYGSIFKDNPSPNTRKKWKRYLNSIPDKDADDSDDDYKRDKKVSYIEEILSRCFNLLFVFRKSTKDLGWRNWWTTKAMMTNTNNQKRKGMSY